MKNHRCINLRAVVFGLSLLGGTTYSSADTPQTHDVPMFHNDDGAGLLQDCRFMRAIANGEITDIPTTVNARSTNCLASIKSLVQVLYHWQNNSKDPLTCIPAPDLDWLEVLHDVTAFLEEQESEFLQKHSYGVSIMQALQKMYPCK